MSYGLVFSLQSIETKKEIPIFEFTRRSTEYYIINSCLDKHISTTAKILNMSTINNYILACKDKVIACKEKLYTGNIYEEITLQNKKYIKPVELAKEDYDESGKELSEYSIFKNSQIAKYLVDITSIKTELEEYTAALNKFYILSNILELQELTNTGYILVVNNL